MGRKECQDGREAAGVGAPDVILTFGLECPLREYLWEERWEGARRAQVSWGVAGDAGRESHVLGRGLRRECHEGSSLLHRWVVSRHRRGRDALHNVCCPPVAYGSVGRASHNVLRGIKPGDCTGLDPGQGSCPDLAGKHGHI
jgi:hypothetical protein